MKNVYLVIPDLHYASYKEHRVNYFSEVLSIIQQLLDICNKLRIAGNKVYLLFLGDIVDGSISKVEDAMRCQDLFSFIRMQVDGIYTVLGNHEENNVSDNPFWFLLSELEDSALEQLAKPIQPKGVSSVIKVPATLQDGEVTFYFNHYGVPAKVPEVDGISIGLFHQNVGSNYICKMWGTFDDVEQASYVQAYNYCYFGHMHLALGKFWLSETQTCQGEWLGTCIGTNINEVTALPRDASIPAIVVVGGKFQRIDHYIIHRSDPKQVIDYSKLERTQASAEFLTKCREVTSTVRTMDSLYTSVHCAADNAGMGFLVDMLQQNYDVVVHEYKQGLENTLTIEDGKEEQDNGCECQ